MFLGIWFPGHRPCSNSPRFAAELRAGKTPETFPYHTTTQILPISIIMKTSDFNYNLPKELIAQEPWPERDQCRLLALDKNTGQLEDLKFFEIEKFLKPGDLLVANETRVLPARLIGAKRGSEGAAELLLLKNLGDNQ